jgi:hypothetical protein
MVDPSNPLATFSAGTKMLSKVNVCALKASEVAIAMADSVNFIFIL